MSDQDVLTAATIARSDAQRPLLGATPIRDHARSAGLCGAHRARPHHDAGKLIRVYPYAELRQDARADAFRLLARGVKPGDRIALIAETAPDFVSLFFGAIYAGAWPVPLPLPTSFGGREAYVEQLATQLRSAEPKLLLYPAELAGMAGPPPIGGVPGQDWIVPRGEAIEAAPRPVRKTSPICNIPAARRASRTASSSPIAPCSAISPPTPNR